MIGSRMVRLAVVAAGTAGGLSGAAYGLLNEQSRHARRVIGPPENAPLRADGIHLPDGTGPVAPSDVVAEAPPLEFAVLGDSSAAGLGVNFPDELPGVRLARGLAEELERPVALTTYATVGATSAELAAQVDTALVAPPRVALLIIGANDVTSRLAVSTCASLLGDAVARLRAAGVGVVVGTCPDLGAIRPIPQPLRSVARTWSLALGKAQRREVDNAGGYAVPLADLLSPEFLARPTEFFSPDRFHPSAAGYEAATRILLPVMCQAIGEWSGGPIPAPPTRSAAAEARRPTSRVIAHLNRNLGRRVTH
jgi:lysophospholipase L1-like esterase